MSYRDRPSALSGCYHPLIIAPLFIIAAVALGVWIIIQLYGTAK